MAMIPYFPLMIELPRNATEEDRIKAFKSYKETMIIYNPQAFENGKSRNPFKIIKELFLKQNKN